MPKIYVHINYFEGNYSLKEAFYHAKEIGFDGIEVRDRDRSGATLLTEYLQLTEELSRETGLEMVYGCRVNTDPRNDEEREASLRDFDQVLRQSDANGHLTANVFTGILHEAGVPYSGTGSAMAKQEDWDSSVKALLEAADKYPRMLLAIETHNGYVHDLAKPCRKLIDLVNRPNVMANYDFGNIVLNWNGESLAESIEILAGKIGYVHLKNVKIIPGEKEGVFERVPLDGGSIDVLEELKLLKQSGYHGVLCIENTMKTDKLPYARSDFKALKEWLRQIS